MKSGRLKRWVQSAECRVPSTQYTVPSDDDWLIGTRYVISRTTYRRSRRNGPTRCTAQADYPQSGG